MDRNLRYVLIINAVFEGLVGATMLFKPDVFFNAPLGNAVAIARMFGMAAIAVCGLSVLMLLRRDESPRTGVFTLAVFHTGLTIAQSLNYADGYVGLQPVLLHAIFAVLFALTTYKYVQR
jgi:hypothetical protein